MKQRIFIKVLFSGDSNFQQEVFEVDREMFVKGLDVVQKSVEDYLQSRYEHISGDVKIQLFDIPRLEVDHG